MTTTVESIVIILTGLSLPLYALPPQITPRIHPICPEGPYPHIISDQDNHLQIPSNQYVICTGKQSPLIFTCSPGQVFDLETHGCVPIITPHNPNRHQFPPNTKPYIPAAPVPEDIDPQPVQKPEHKVPCEEKPNSSGGAPPDDSPMQRPYPVDIPIFVPDSVDETPVQRPHPVDIPILRPQPVDDAPMQRPYPIDIPILRPQPVDDAPIQRPYPIDIPILRPNPVDSPILRPDPIGDLPIQRPYPDDQPAHLPFPPINRPYPIDFPLPRPFPIEKISVRKLYPTDSEPKSPTPTEVDDQPPIHSRPIFEHQSEPVHSRPMYDPRDPIKTI